MPEKEYLILLDTYNQKGAARKVNLYMAYEEALTFADDDINENRQLYKEKFLRGEFP